MPQMMPMNLITLPMTFLICYLILIVLLFSFKLSTPNTLNLNNTKMFTLSWKW